MLEFYQKNVFKNLLMIKKIIFFLALFITAINFNTKAQSCIGASSLVHSPGSLNGMMITDDDQIITVGTYNAPFTYQGNTIQPDGYLSVYVMFMDTSYNLIRLTRVMSFLNSGSGFKPPQIYHIAVDKNKNVIVGGNFSDSLRTNSNIYFGDHAADGFVAKFDSLGNEIFVKTFQGTGSGVHFEDYVRDVAVDSAGNVYATGGFEDTYLVVDNDTVTNSNYGGWYKDVFTVSLNPLGQANWLRSFGARNIDDAALNIAADINGNVVVSGGTDSGAVFHFGMDTVIYNTGYFANHGYVASYDASGNELWFSRISSVYSYGDAVPYGIDFDNSGNAYLTGHFQGTKVLFGNDTIRGNGSTNAFLVKYNRAGVKLWSRTGKTDAAYPYPQCVAVRGNKIIISGQAYTNQGLFGPYALGNSADMYIASYDTSGNIQWARSADEGTGGILSWDAAVDSRGRAYIAGIASGTINIYPSIFTTSSTDWYIARMDTLTASAFTASISVLSNDTITCGDPVSLKAIPSPIPSGSTYIVWTSNNASYINGFNLITNDYPSENSIYILNAIRNGCSVLDTVAITVLPFNIDAGTDTTVCGGDSIQLNGNTIYQAHYQWIPSTGLSNDTIRNPLAAVNSSTNFIYHITKRNCSQYDTVVVNVTPPLIANYNLSQLGMTVNLTNNSQSYNSFYWDFNDGNIDSITLNPQHQYVIPGNYTICLYVFNDCGKDSICKSVNVTNVGLEEITNCEPTFVQNGNSIQINCNGCINKFDCTIYSMDGRLVYSKKNSSCSENINADFLKTNQVYIAEIKSAKKVSRFKLMFSQK